MSIPVPPEGNEGPQQPQPPQYQSAPQYQQPGIYDAAGPGEPFNGASTVDDLGRPLYGASFGQAISRFFKNYATFSGRASRSEYWWAALFTALIAIVPSILAAALPIVGIILLVIVGLGTIIPSLAITWRRLHDANFAGPFYFLSLTYIGSIVVFVFLLLPSKPEGRRFDRI